MYKALTVVNLPFIDGGKGKKFLPGETITSEDIDQSVAEGSALFEKMSIGETVTHDSLVAELLDFGSISDDPNAPILKEHEPVDPGAPTIERLVYEAQQLIDREGDNVPPEIKQLAALETNHVVASEGGDSVEVAG